MAKRKRTRVPSAQQIKVLKLLLAHTDTHGYDMMKRLSIGPGTLYGLLKRLTDEGYVQKSAEIVDGRCRIAYRLTVDGVQYAERAILEDEYEQGIRDL